jgi:hypothetical protein
MSDTPRTDEQAQLDAAKYCGHSRDYVSLVKFTRELERENNELRELVRLLTIEEVSDSGHALCPTEITSCLEKIHTILQKHKPTQTL